MDIEIGWNRFNLTLIGLWPEPREVSNRSRIIAEILFWSTSTLILSCIVAPETANLILESGTLDEVVENLSINLPIAIALAKQYVLRYHKKALAVLVGQVYDDWSKPIIERDLELMMKNGRTSRIISIGSSMVTYIMLVAFISSQVWSNINDAYETDLGGMIYPTTFPYNTTVSPNYELTWLGQFFGTILTAICYSAFDAFLAYLVFHLCGQLNVLGAALNEIANEKVKDMTVFWERMTYIVNRHNQLARFAVVVENCFNIILLIQTLLCTAMFCLTGYRLIISVDQEQEEVPFIGMAFFFTHVAFTTLHLYIYCYVGEALLGHSTCMSEAAFYCKWYDLPPKCAVSLIIVICRTRVAFQITAGKFSPFSLELFNTCIRTSAGYLSVLLAMKERVT